MARQRTAPQLTALMNLSGVRTMAGGLMGLKAARAELRALKAVASAAQWYSNAGRRLGAGLVCLCHGQDCCAGCSLDRALARLDRRGTK